MTGVTCPVWSRDFWVAYTGAHTPMYPHAKFGENRSISFDVYPEHTDRLTHISGLYISRKHTIIFYFFFFN
jgi:hypothetical protein